MTKAEQNRLFEDLVQIEYAIQGKDKELFRKLLSRHKDDEDFDTAAATQLQSLHDTYKPRRSKEELDALWKKMTSGGKKQ